LRRELFEQFNDLVFDEDQSQPLVNVNEEVFIVVRQFLTSRNDAINDDKRLSFDKAIFELRRACAKALKSTPPSTPSEGVSSHVSP